MNDNHGAYKMCDQLLRRIGPHVCSLACTILLGSAAAGSLHAGSVFMKNGYIIQGEVVDRDQESIVLGWPNGKVAIAWRFIEEVSIEPDEEQNLRELEQMRRQIENRAAEEEQLNMLSETRTTPDLPATLDSFLQTYDLLPDGRGRGELENMSIGGLSEDGREPVVVAGSQTNETVGVADVTPQPADVLGEPVSSPVWRVNFQPPGGWSQEVTPEALRVVSSQTTGDISASLSVQVVPAGPLDTSDYVSLLEAEHSRLLGEHEVLSKGWRQVGDERAFEIVSRGSYEGRVAVVRQCLVVRDNDVWLISAFTGDDALDGDFGRIERTLATFEFLRETAE